MTQQRTRNQVQRLTFRVTLRDPAGRANPLGRFGRISAQLKRSSLSRRLKVLKLPG